MFKDDIYETMIENDEMWFIQIDGNAILILDLPLYDC